MCGINAIYRYQGISETDRDRISRMDAEMTYRGPDGEGTWFGEQAALGMRRLAIIGLKGGDQPIFNEDRSLVLVCNGEIYNHPEIRKDLEARGRRYATTTDSESVLRLYEEYGTDCVDHLRGMFAFALWDEKKKRLFVARDRVGEVPLYFAENHQGVVFSSELKAIANHAIERLDPDYDSIRQTLRYSYPVDLRNTFIRQIKRLLPGERAIVDANGLCLEKYWKPRFKGNYSGTRKNAEEDVLNALRESVSLRMRSEVPVAVLLSGGIDSAAIAALIAKSHSGVQAITAGYRGRPDCDETEEAEKIAKAIGIKWERVELDESDFLNYFDDLVHVIDEPVGDKSAIAQWAIYRKAKEKGLKVLLSGNGGDELFFGYPYWNQVGYRLDQRMQWERLAEKRRRHRIPSKVGFLARRLVSEPLSLFDAFAPSDRSGIFAHPYYDHRARYLKDADWPNGNSLRAPDPFTAFLDEADNGPDLIASILFSTWLPANCLHLSNKLGLGNSVELRAPLLDHKLVDLVFSLPIEWRFSRSEPKTFLKGILRGVIPDRVLEGKKRGFTPPDPMIEKIIQKSEEKVFGKPAIELVDVLVSRMMRNYFGNSYDAASSERRLSRKSRD
ncbi:MAG: asparagine synthase (glutamine-hydrolyzing) [Bdellovibrionales bacterium]|nr:asparagine synthase (glutamine-hydrolyzing) [Bdellovibrionales bacterium]